MSDIPEVFDSEPETLTAVHCGAGCSGSRGLPAQWATLRVPTATNRPSPSRRATAAAPIPHQTGLAQRQVAAARGSRWCRGLFCALTRAQRALKKTQRAAKTSQWSGGRVIGAGRGGRPRLVSSLWRCATQAERHQLPLQVGAPSPTVCQTSVLQAQRMLLCSPRMRSWSHPCISAVCMTRRQRSAMIELWEFCLCA